jgi:acetoin:2,6-dichlorophenolindophenol oxidoreductase subunit beta
LVVADPAPLTCSVASEIAALVAEHAFPALVAPILRVTAPDIPVPFSPTLERLMYPTAEKIASAVRRITLDRRQEEVVGRV